MNDRIRGASEKMYEETRVAWSKVLPKIQKHKEELLDMPQKEAIENAHGNLDQLRIEIQAADELLKMDPDQIEKVAREYDIFTSQHESLWEDPEKGFRLEAQRHWIPQLITIARESLE